MLIHGLLTERLFLRYPLEDEAGKALDPAAREALVDRLVAVFADPEMSRFMQYVPHPYSRKDALGFLDFLEKGAEYPGHLELGIHAREGGPLLGMVSLEDIDREAGSAEVGYWLAREAQGRGLALEAVQALVGWGFRRLGLQRIAAWVSAGHEASLALLDKAGFVREGLLRRSAFFKGALCDRHVLSILREEWEARRAAAGDAAYRVEEL